MSNQLYLVEFEGTFVDVQVLLDTQLGTLRLVTEDNDELVVLTNVVPSKLKAVAKETLLSMGVQFEDEVRNRLAKVVPEMYV